MLWKTPVTEAKVYFMQQVSTVLSKDRKYLINCAVALGFQHTHYTGFGGNSKYLPSNFGLEKSIINGILKDKY